METESRMKYASMPQLPLEIAIIEAQPFSGKALASAKSLKLIASVRTTPSNVDMAVASGSNILVSNAPGRNAIAVAEFTIGLILACARNIPQAFHALKSGNYLLPAGVPANNNPDDVIWSNPRLERRPYIDFRGHEISGATLGIFGLGYIGRLVASRAIALGMQVIAFDPFVDEKSAKDAGCRSVNFESLLAESDYLSLHAKTSNETRGIFNLASFGRMKRSAYLINTARGALINQPDLVMALRDRLIAGAALDVFESEPLQAGCELLSFDNVIATPHIGGASVDVIRHQSLMVLRNIDAYMSGKNLPDAWGKK